MLNVERGKIVTGGSRYEATIEVNHWHEPHWEKWGPYRKGLVDQYLRTTSPWRDQLSVDLALKEASTHSMLLHGLKYMQQILYFLAGLISGSHLLK